VTRRGSTARACTVSLALAALGASCAGAPSIFSSAGIAADRISSLGWFLTIIACAVTVIVSALLLVALLRPRPEHSGEVQRLGPSVRWIVIGGVIVPAVILVVAFGVSVFTQSAIADPPSRAVATIRVTAHRWWWEVKYIGAPDQTVMTANEIHVPVGKPVRLELVSDDVVHSFWVPRLAGKMDVIPGQRNTMWMEADRPGTYLGECAEYCGLQHAHMNFVVVAEAPEKFEAWLAHQRTSAAAPTDSVARRGLSVFQSSACAACHAIRGSEALGRIGPDLTHLASRRTIAAGALLNSRGNLAGWIANAQSIKPGSDMPTIPLRSADSQALLVYLETLR